MSSSNETKYPDRIPIDSKVIEAIERERAYSSKYWDAEFDSKNTINDWWAYVNIYFARGAKMRESHVPVEQYRSEQRKALVKAASLALSALEAFDANGGFQERHYD